MHELTNTATLRALTGKMFKQDAFDNIRSGAKVQQRQFAGINQNHGVPEEFNLSSIGV
jgi:hypothetical protein